jgi:hypothetical protein
LLGFYIIFIANELLKGKRFIKVTACKTIIDWAKSIKDIADEYYPETEKIILVMDNLNAHTESALYEVYETVEAKKNL